MFYSGLLYYLNKSKSKYNALIYVFTKLASRYVMMPQMFLVLVGFRDPENQAINCITVYHCIHIILKHMGWKFDDMSRIYLIPWQFSRQTAGVYKATISDDRGKDMSQVDISGKGKDCWPALQ